MKDFKENLTKNQFLFFTGFNIMAYFCASFVAFFKMYIGLNAMNSSGDLFVSLSKIQNNISLIIQLSIIALAILLLFPKKLNFPKERITTSIILTILFLFISMPILKSISQKLTLPSIVYPIDQIVLSGLLIISLVCYFLGKMIDKKLKN